MLYEDVFVWLERDEVRYVVVGSFALVLHGHDRAAADLDLVVDPEADNTRRATCALVRAGFFPTIPLGLDEVTVLRMLDGAGRRVDVFARFFVPFAELLAGSVRVRVGGQLVRVASLADLVRVKRLTGRPRDLEDAERLLRACDEGRQTRHESDERK